MPDNNNRYFQVWYVAETKTNCSRCPYIKAEVELAREDRPEKDDKNFQVLADTCKEICYYLKIVGTER